MAKFKFTKATKTGTFLRLALLGPAGSGKTWTALALATGLGQRIAVIDTEHGSASKYAKEFSFDVCALESFEPLTYVEAIGDAVAAGFDVVIVDSLSHAWMGKGGALEQVDRAKKRSNGNGFNAWGDVTPQHNALVDAMLRCDAHLIVTMRTKMEYVQEKDERTGKTVVRKVGMAPVQRDGLEYEFDVVGDLDGENNLSITKTRCSSLSGEVIAKPGAALAATLAAWLSDAEPVVRHAPDAEPDPLAIPPALAAFHAALPGLADVQAAAALWHAHLPALDAAAADHRAAARAALVKRVVQFGGGVGSPTAAKNALKRHLDELAARALAASAEASAPATPAEASPVAPEAAEPAAEPVAHAAGDAAPTPQSPALAAFYARLEEIELPGESVAVWMKYRDALAALPVPDREAAWRALCARTETVGRMKNAKVWLKKAIAEEDARTGFPAGSQTANQPDEPALSADVMESLLADVGTARDAATLATVWEAITADDYHRASPAQRAQLDAARDAREKALRTPPTPPKGTRSRRDAEAPADAAGRGEASANDSTTSAHGDAIAPSPTAGAQACAEVRVELDADETERRLTRADAAGDAAWRDHCAATVAEKVARGLDPRAALAQGYAKRRFTFARIGGTALAMAREDATVDAMVVHGGDREWNRALIASRCTRFAAEITAGRWRVTHQGVAFGADGMLYDGQNRLHAIG